MRLRSLRRRAWAVWLGVAALVLNALVPVHFAFDMAEALAPAAHAAGHVAPGFEHRLFALLSLHLDGLREAAPHHHHGHEHNHNSADHHHRDCAVCSALCSLTGVAPPAPAALTGPAPVVALPPAVAPAASRAGIATAGYRSRAPPAA